MFPIVDELSPTPVHELVERVVGHDLLGPCERLALPVGVDLPSLIGDKPYLHLIPCFLGRWAVEKVIRQDSLLAEIMSLVAEITASYTTQVWTISET